ncbi:hypothetical protein DERP_013290 [Dermatophagoides pteronyssinus]|uniref:Uncharacterized protein n=1 Tax=Dermatophagoides pteronyssinus TaxID=6956 RepID=A0ABQ8J427_DERPT|nr:hypothetical protein DERP_013290 [Dermatophagoides pteronyssinus]
MKFFFFQLTAAVAAKHEPGLDSEKLPKSTHKPCCIIGRKYRKNDFEVWLERRFLTKKVCKNKKAKSVQKTLSLNTGDIYSFEHAELEKIVVKLA